MSRIRFPLTKPYFHIDSFRYLIENSNFLTHAITVIPEGGRVGVQ